MILTAELPIFHVCKMKKLKFFGRASNFLRILSHDYLKWKNAMSNFSCKKDFIDLLLKKPDISKS